MPFHKGEDAGPVLRFRNLQTVLPDEPAKGKVGRQNLGRQVLTLVVQLSIIPIS